MYTDEIFAVASAFCGAENETLRPICAVAEKEITGKLSDGVSPGDCSETLIVAAALLAVSIYGQVLSGGSEAASFSAGDVSVTNKSGGSIASAGNYLRSQAELMMAPYIDDNGFSFLGVRGY